MCPPPQSVAPWCGKLRGRHSDIVMCDAELKERGILEFKLMFGMSGWEGSREMSRAMGRVTDLLPVSPQQQGFFRII